jgi:hypothetical protein
MKEYRYSGPASGVTLSDGNRNPALAGEECFPAGGA